MSGFFITREAVDVRIGEDVGFTLMSDLHIGAAITDHDAIVRDLERAKHHGDRIYVNGDVFDAILPKDVKRFKPDALHAKLQRRNDVLDAAEDMAMEILAPFAKQIRMIGMGNHETAIEKFHSTDLIARLIRRLNAECKGSVAYGGYTGFIETTMRSGARSRGHNKGYGNHQAVFVIYYHHGAGASAPITRGMIDFSRKQWVDADVVWLGHKHNRIADGTMLRMRCPRVGDEPVFSYQVSVMSGGYFDTLRGQTSEDALRNGRRSNYASDFGLAPQAKGGVRVVTRLTRHGIARTEVVI